MLGIKNILIKEDLLRNKIKKIFRCFGRFRYSLILIILLLTVIFIGIDYFFRLCFITYRAITIPQIATFIGTIIGFGIAGYGLYLLNRRTKAVEDQIKLTDRQITEDRFAKAYEQVGSKNLAIRSGGLNLLDVLSFDTEESCYRVWKFLSGFLRNPPDLDEHPNSDFEERMGNRPDIKEVIQMLREVKNNRFYNPKMIDLSGADLTKAQLNGVNLSGSNLTYVILNEAFLNDADLSGANLSGAKLPHANLLSADLFGSFLTGGTDLSNATLERSDLSCLGYKSNADFSHANLQLADLLDSNLSKANLSETNLYSARLVGAWVSKNILDAGCLIGANIENIITEDWEDVDAKDQILRKGAVDMPHELWIEFLKYFSYRHKILYKQHNELREEFLRILKEKFNKNGWITAQRYANNFFREKKIEGDLAEEKSDYQKFNDSLYIKRPPEEVRKKKPRWHKPDSES